MNKRDKTLTFKHLNKKDQEIFVHIWRHQLKKHRDLEIIYLCELMVMSLLSLEKSPPREQAII